MRKEAVGPNMPATWDTLKEQPIREWQQGRGSHEKRGPMQPSDIAGSIRSTDCHMSPRSGNFPVRLHTRILGMSGTGRCGS